MLALKGYRGLILSMKFIAHFWLLKKGLVFSPFPHPSKTPIGGLYYQYSLLHIFDLLKKGWFSLPFLAIIALLLFLRNLTFLVFRTVPLSLYTVSGNGTIPIFPISAACAALLLSFFFLHSLLHLTPSRLDRLSYHYIILPFSRELLRLTLRLEVGASCFNHYSL